MTLREVAAVIGGELHGDGALQIDNLATRDTADDGSLIFAFDAAEAGRVEPGCAAAAVIREGATCALPYITVLDVRAAQNALLQVFRRPVPPPSGIHPTAVVDPSAVIGADASIGPLVVIGPDTQLGDRVRVGAQTVIGARCVIGDDTALAANVTLYDDVRLGARCIIHAGAVLGADGYGYQFVDGRHQGIPQIGGVVLEDEVEVGANTCIDRATLGVTKIGAGTKIDNLVMIAHNVSTGQHCLIISQVGIAGSTTLGNAVIVAGQAGLADHLTIGDGVMIGAQAGVAKNATPGQRLLGTPALPGIEFHRMMAALTRLPDMIREYRAAQRQEAAAKVRVEPESEPDDGGAGAATASDA
ncbi:MAG TPA: UDP-3-O-(3-hydroxymyristoyl)glucosamine N-acyltransferase [Armatimonadetes bacterium]|nr:UDP-3-O-(3-hydroxymyristoyl)glucosamine N-acyltransferase [Armatimonadota bacterium]